MSFSKSLIHKGLVGLIDAKGIDVAQPIWLRDCPTLSQIQAKNVFFVFLGCCCLYHRTASQPYRLSYNNYLKVKYNIMQDLKIQNLILNRLYSPYTPL